MDVDELDEKERPFYKCNENYQRVPRKMREELARGMSKTTEIITAVIQENLALMQQQQAQARSAATPLQEQDQDQDQDQQDE